MELEGIRVSQNMETNKGNSVLPLMETNKIFPLPPLAVPSTGAILPPVSKSFPSSWADRVESSTPSSGMGKTTFSSIEEQQIVPDTARYFIMRTTETFSKVSPFLIEKATSGSIGAVKTIRKMRSGDFFIEVSSSQQASALTKLRHLATIDVTVVAHRSLNYSRGVISAADLQHVSTEEILENLQDQKVCGAKRITIRRDGQVLNTKHLILTFATPSGGSPPLAKSFLDCPVSVVPHKSLNSCRGVISEPDLLTTTDAEILDGFSGQVLLSPNLPTSIKAGYLNCKIRPYIPNPLRCFKCQRFGHSQTACRGQLTCSRCASVGHASSDCTLEQKCINCSQPHSADSKLCPKWKIEKEIQTFKTNRNISYIEARKFITPQPSQTYAQVAKSITVNSSSQTDETITQK
ncbi:uncharacterized protein TNCV_3937891 [Trichonephila clavipes]|nr:uncharacterized protein TNCV_3937891 [Trichonephila clavipes]